MTIVDLALHAATLCHNCRTLGRPHDDSDQEHGDQFSHPNDGAQGAKRYPCSADQIWGLIRKLENQKAKI